MDDTQSAAATRPELRVEAARRMPPPRAAGCLDVAPEMKKTEFV